MEVDRRALRDILLRYFSVEEFRMLSFDLGVDVESIGGDSKASQITNLIAYMDRRAQLPELVTALTQLRPDIIEFQKLQPEKSPIAPTATEAEKSDIELARLNVELASLRQQLTELQQGSLNNQKVEALIDEMIKTANRAFVRSEDLTARVILPRQEDMNVRLVASHSLERLDEYRSDENITFLLIGLFAGSILGILSNWVTNEALIITRFSVVLMGIMAILTISCVIWARMIRSRADAVKKQMLSDKSTNIETK